jgi:hypothetical protein
MKKILSLICFIASGAQAAVPGTSNSVITPIQSNTAATMGGTTLTIPFASFATAAIYRLCGGYNTTATSGAYYGLYSANNPNTGQTTFQVPSGATKGFLGITVEYGTPAGSFYGVKVGYGTALLGSENNTSAPAGAVTYGPPGTTSIGMYQNLVATTYYNFSAAGVNFPPGSYPYVQNVGGTGAFIFCITGVVQ